MIRPSSLALGEAIAIAFNSDTPIPAKQMIAGLNEQSYGSAAYSDQFRAEIPAVTGGNTAHSPMLDATSDQLAKVIRGGFDMIKSYGVPFAQALAAEIDLLYTQDRLQQLAFSGLSYNFINVDDPFFDSAVYPDKVISTAFDFSSISLDALSRLEFGYVSEDELRAYVNTNHPDVLEVLQSTDWDLSNAGNAIGSIHDLQDMFVCKGKVFDFTQIKNLQINRLLKMYVILTKMYTDKSTPVTWLTKGTLGDYREYIDVLWNGLTRYLIGLKQIVTTFRNRVVSIGQVQPVILGAHANTDYEGAKFLNGNVQIYYTDKALATLEAGNVSFNEWLVAVQYSRLVSPDNALEPVAALGDPASIKKWATDYYRSIDSALSSKAKVLFVKAAAGRAIKFLLETPLLRERVRELCPQNVMPETWFAAKIGDEYERAYHNVSKALVTERETSGNELDGDGNNTVVLDALLSSTIVPVFLRAINCNLAADIVEATYVSVEGNDSVADKRQRLHVSLIQLIVKHSIEAK